MPNPLSKLNPPIEYIPIGETRNFKLLNTEQSCERTIANDNLYELPAIATFFPEKNMQIIGSYNQYGEIFIFKNKEENGVYILDIDVIDNPPILIAESVVKFYKIIVQAHHIWKDIHGDITMRKTPDNQIKREIFLQYIQTLNPKADISYWDYQVFRELTIGMM